MTDILTLLKSLISIPGLSGHEAPVRRLIEDSWRPLVDEVHISRLGSLHALKRGTLSDSHHRLLLAAHMDAIGLMVTGVDGEFLRITEVGGVDARVLPGQSVIVHGREDLPGVITQTPTYLLPPESRKNVAGLQTLLVDTGLTARQVSRRVRPGDLVSFAQAPIEMDGEILVGHSLDNRASVAALTLCLQELHGRQLAWDVWAVATVQEEETLGGASTSAYQLRPALAVVIDVTYGAGFDSPNHQTFPIGKGLTLGWGPTVHPGLYKTFKELAERLEIPVEMEVMPGASSTDADSLQVVSEGIPTIVLGIPIRNMHTPVEMVSMKDITRTGRLIAEFAANLGADYMDELIWED